ncbi:MAG: sensor histidine kinase [Leptolyngbyaceae cyanobacterium MAG.088]|nr:sensor histidine kinase [Leptolyngbyaceae cyanobacterium MAG.088]
MGDRQQIEEFEKTIRILRKKLARSEKDRKQIESDVAAKEALLKTVIHKLKTSKTTLEQRTQDLQDALDTMQLMQVQLVQSAKMSVLGQTTAGIAHEINNPIGFIYSNLDHLDEYIQDLFKLIHLYHHYLPSPPTQFYVDSEDIDIELIEEDIPQILQSMNRGTQRIRDIVLALRNFSRLHEAGYKAVDIHKSIDNILMLLQQKLSGIEVVKNYGELPLLHCSAGDLNQALINILNNAINAIAIKNGQTEGQLSDPSVITITTQYQSNQQVVVNFKDNGTGISPEIIDKVFDPFFTTQEIGQGIGLGLTIARQIIVDQHGGHIDIQSELGRGTEFLIRLSSQC